MALSVWLLSVTSCNLICLWTVAHTLATDIDAPSSSSAGAPPYVHVSVSVSEHFVTLSCDVTGTRAGADDHKVQFFCPVLAGDMQCFGDCSPLCTMQTDGSCRVLDPILEDPGSVACQKVVGQTVAGRESKSVHLRVDTRQARLAGAWRCKFRGASSATVTLAQQRAPAEPTVAAAAGVAADAPEATAAEGGLEPAGGPSQFTEPPQQAKPTASPPEQYGLGVWNPDAKKYPSDLAATQGFERDSTLAKFARIDYIIGVLTIMSVSLLLNLGFCIRCVLARHYVETRKRNQRRPLDWLGSCLCVSTVQVMLDADAADAAAAAAAAGGDRTAAAQQRRRWRGGDADGGQQRRHLLPQQSQTQQHPPCLYCMQADCRILYDDVARSGSSDCGSSCRGGGGGSFRLAGGFEGHGPGRGSMLGVPAVPEESATPTELAGDKPQQQQDDAGSETSVSASDPSSRLELSRRMLRKADTLLREANSLLLETESTTDLQPDQ